MFESLESSAGVKRSVRGKTLLLVSFDGMRTLELTWELISVTRSDSGVAAAGVGSRLEARVACWTWTAISRTIISSYKCGGKRRKSIDAAQQENIHSDVQPAQSCF